MNKLAIPLPDAVPTLLGRGPMRIPTGGKIRAGIKVLTKAAANHPKARELYDRGVLANKSFEEIEREIATAAPELRHPLVPKNVPWFTVRPQDFAHPAIAAMIMERFAEDHGDGVARLYRFPVVFPADAWQAVMPHELVAWGASDKRFWSEYSSDGRERVCKCYAPVPMDASGKRAIRTFGGRKIVSRNENEGLCDPERCAEYQNRQCNLSGRFVFFIPGIPSIQAFELHTNSFYAMNAAIQKFETVAFLRGGRISGFLDVKRTPFFLSKRLMEVPHIDAEGRAVRVSHWIIELEAPVDVTALLRDSDDDVVVSAASRAVQVLEGAPRVIEPEQMGAFPEAGLIDPKGETEGPHGSPANDTAFPVVPNAQTGVPSTAVEAAAGPGNGAARAVSTSTPPSTEDVIAVAMAFGVSAERYGEYATKRWGGGWKLNAGGRRRALEELQRFVDTPDEFVVKLDAELDLFA